MRTLATLLIVAASVLGSGGFASGQATRPERAYRGLFGGNAADPKSTQNLDLNLSLSASYDDNVLADRGQQGASVDPRFQKSGGYGSGQIGLDYGKRGARGSLSLSAGSSYRYYPSIESLTGFNYSASAGFSLRITGRTTLTAAESASYSPYYQFASFGSAAGVPGEIALDNADYPLVERPAVSYYTSATLNHRLTQRATFAADYRMRYTDFRREDRPMRDWGGGGIFSYRVTRHATARLGYHYRKGSYGLYHAGRPVEGHDIDAGVDYSRSLSISRRTTFGFTSGSSIYRTFYPTLESADEVMPGSSQDLRLRTRYMVTANAYLNRQMGRSWNARLDYRRGLHFVEGFPEPFFSDMVTAGVGGFAGSRTRISLSVAYNDGEVGLYGVNGRNYEMYTGTAGVQFALTRMTALSVNYFYYHYEFGGEVVLPAGMNRGLDRNGIRAGLSLWLPLLR